MNSNINGEIKITEMAIRNEHPKDFNRETGPPIEYKKPCSKTERIKASSGIPMKKEKPR